MPGSLEASSCNNLSRIKVALFNQALGIQFYFILRDDVLGKLLENEIDTIYMSIYDVVGIFTLSILEDQSHSLIKASPDIQQIKKFERTNMSQSKKFILIVIRS